MKKTGIIIFSAFAFVVVSGSLVSFKDPMPQIKQNVLALSKESNLDTQAVSIVTVGPYQKINVSFFKENKKHITATYHAWFGMMPQSSCYSESLSTPCHSEG